jgi:hypothetical protein
VTILLILQKKTDIFTALRCSKNHRNGSAAMETLLKEYKPHDREQETINEICSYWLFLVIVRGENN